MLVRKLVLLGLLLAICALAARFQSPTPGLPGEVSHPPVWPRPDIGRTYVLEHIQGQLQIRRKGKPDGIVWSELERNPNWGYWSPDGTHLALYQMGTQPQLRVWNPWGIGLYRGDFLNSEGPFECVFSPDNSSLLLRVARVQGMFDVNLGQLYSLDLKVGKSVYWEETARKVEWLDSFRFRCWVSGTGDGLTVHEYDTRKPPVPRRSPPVWNLHS